MPDKRRSKNKWATSQGLSGRITFLLIYNAQLILHSGPLQFHATLEAASTTAVA
jgi:hypothetical protein